MSYLCFLFIVDGGVLEESSCLICVFYLLFMVVSCRMAHVLFVFFIYCRCWCPVGGLMFYLCFLFIVDGEYPVGGSYLMWFFYSLWMVVSCRRAHVLFVFLFSVDGGVL